MQEYNMEDFKLEGFTEKECKEIKKILSRFLKSYGKKTKEMSDEEWLYGKLKEELPEKGEEELRKMSQEIIVSIHEYDKNLEDLTASCSKGTTKEQWFADKISDAAQGVAVNDYGNYLQSIDSAIGNAIAQMYRTATTQSGDISKCVNLDGFIAEQHHVNSFNKNAALQKSPYRAEVCVPQAGETYGKNSFDVVIKDIRTGKRVNQYQIKYGKDAETTIKLLNQGNYNNQRIVVPQEQVEAVKKAFPNKSVEGFIGGNGEIEICSDPLTKAEAKRLQIETQDGQTVATMDWNSYNTRNLALQIGKEAGIAGVTAAAITTGFDMVKKIVSREPMDVEETVEQALKTGTDAGVKAATTGALKVAVEKEVISVLPKGTPAGILANVACVGIENIKILSKVATGDLMLSEAAEKMGRTTTSMVAGISCSSIGMGAGVAALSWIPIAGPVIGGVVGGMVGYAAGSKFGEKVYNGAKKVGERVKETAKRVVEGAKNFVGNVRSKVRSLFR